MIAIRRLHVVNYRSVRSLSFPLRRLNVFFGENGVGKTNLYRAAELLRAAALGTLTRELAAEGGMESAFWAGTRRRNETVRIRLGCELGEEGSRFAYGADAGLLRQYVECGQVASGGAGFPREPQVKEERLEQLAGRRKTVLLSRANSRAQARDRDGSLQDLDVDLLPSETALASVRDPGRFPDLAFAREHMAAWRFHHGFRTDADSPLRRPCLG